VIASRSWVVFKVISLSEKQVVLPMGPAGGVKKDAKSGKA